MRQNLILISLIALFILPFSISAQNDADSNSAYPVEIGDRAKYEMVIEMPKAYVSGILIMARIDDKTINASIINEFGVSLMDLSYDEKKHKIKLHSVMKKLDNWRIKYVLKKDLKNVFETIKEGGSQYTNNKRKINYTFNLINETTGSIIQD